VRGKSNEGFIQWVLHFWVSGMGGTVAGRRMVFWKGRDRVPDSYALQHNFADVLADNGTTEVNRTEKRNNLAGRKSQA